MLESELKIKIESHADIYSRLGGDFKIVGGYFSKDIYFDSEKFDFSKNDKVFRLRKQSDKFFITFKGSRQSDNTLIIRDEYEVGITDYEIGYKIIHSLGFKPCEIVEKRRVEINYFKFENLKIFLDTLPFIGDFKEVEGEKTDILKMIEFINLDLNNSTQLNYSELFLKYCDENSILLKNPRMQFTFYDENMYYKKRQQ